MPKLPKDFAALVYVHFGLFAAAFGAAWYVHTQPPKLPLIDEWLVLSDWTRAESTAGWCIAHHHEHRFPLTKAMWMGVLRVTGFRFDAPQYATFAFHMAAAILVLWTARRLRGRTHPIDLALAVLYLHFGHGLNWLMGYQLGFGLLAYGTAGWLWTAGRLACGGGSGWAVLSAVYTLPVLFCGGFGIGFTPAIALWFAFLALRVYRSGNSPAALGLLLGGILAGAYTVWALITLPTFLPGGQRPTDEPLVFVSVVGGYFGTALGAWPISGGVSPIMPPLVCGLVAAAYAVGTVRLVRRIRRIREASPTDVACLLVIFGTLVCAVAAGRARPGAILDRYAIASTGGLVALALSFIGPRTAPAAGFRALAVGAVCLAIAGALWRLNAAPGMFEAYRFRDSSHHLALDIKAGLPPMFLTGKHSGAINTNCGEVLTYYLRNLKRAGIPPFDAMPDDPPFRAEPIPGLPERAVWICPESQYFAGRDLPGLALPDPPTGAFGVRLVADTKKWYGRSKLILNWIDRTTGQPRAETAYPAYYETEVLLAFKLTGSPERLRLLLGSPVAVLHLYRFEWLIADPHQ